MQVIPDPFSCQEEFEIHERKISDMIKYNMQSTNNLLDKIFVEVVEITKVLNLLRINLTKS